MAMLTIMGMYDYDNTIFDSLTLPEGLDRTSAIDSIVLECAELECLYPSVPFLKRAIGIWSATMQSSFNRVWSAVNLDYNPIENYDRQEQETTTGMRQHSGKDTTTGSNTDTHTISDSGSVNNKIAGFDSTTLVDHDSGTSTRTGSDSLTGSETTELTHGEKIDDSGSRTSRIHGNIGVTTSQQMLESELDLVPRLNFYRYLAEEFKRRFCILVY